jgi:predicted heme/steroid binding protein
MSYFLFAILPSFDKFYILFFVNKNAVIMGIVGVLLVLGVGGFVFLSKNSSSIPSTSSINSTATSPTKAPEEKKKGFTLEDVAMHPDATSCWAAVNGKVYDLTSWIDKHPGGPERILSICGKDGSSAFETQHAGQPKPESYLSSFYIGELSSN